MMPTDDAAVRVAQIRARHAEHSPPEWSEVAILLTALAAAERTLQAWQDTAASYQTQAVLHAERAEQLTEQLTAAERTRDQALRDVQRHGAMRAGAEAQLGRLAALEQAARAWDAAVQAEIRAYESEDDDWSERMGAAHLVRQDATEALHMIVRTLAAPPGETP
jgi:ribulose-5-phosphate 4-epimerase/fuculose-1-phosphate aldolase